MSKKNNDSSSDIKRMSTLLLSGATMLSDSCPDCNIPLFKKNENIFCSKCKRKAIFASSNEEIKQIEQSLSFSESRSILQDILIGKLNFLAQKLAASEDLKEMNAILQVMDLLINLTIRITDIQKKIL